MAKHSMKMSTQGDLEVKKSDVFFDVYADGKKLGRLAVSVGAVEWYAKNARKPTHKVKWNKIESVLPKKKKK